MLITRHVSADLARYCDGQLDSSRARAVERHLATCTRCRKEHEDIRFAASLIARLDVVAPPTATWWAIESELDADAPRHARKDVSYALRWASGAVVAILIAAGVYSSYDRSAEPSWEVAQLNGETTLMTSGEWVETGRNSSARIVVGDIGTVDVEPESRVRLGALSETEYRMALARGTIRARIAAPPRLFFVDTPASTVVDLGCAYTVNVNDQGTGELRVTEGWASLEWGNRESLVPAGAYCRIEGRIGPGTPYFEDASPAFQQALAAFDFAAGGSPAVERLLAEARVRDTLTLWHLLSRVNTADRERVYDRIAELVPPPPTVARDKALQLDAATLKHWREELAWQW